MGKALQIQPQTVFFKSNTERVESGVAEWWKKWVSGLPRQTGTGRTSAAHTLTRLDVS